MSEHNHTHTHVDENGRVYEHSHGHHHSHAQTKAVLNRLSRAQGHLDAVRKMVERGEDCAEVLVQLSAVISALNGTGRAILKDHISHPGAERCHRPLYAVALRTPAAECLNTALRH